MITTLQKKVDFFYGNFVIDVIILDVNMISLNIEN